MKTAETARILDCPWLDQHERWPTGCESVTAALALGALGLPVDPDFFIDRCLPVTDGPVQRDGVWRGPDPRHFYFGDPRTEDGWGCFAPAVARGLETYASLTGADLTVREHYGLTLDALFRQKIDHGIPVIFFATMGMAPPRPRRSWILPDGRNYVWKSPMHCLLLVGYDRGTGEAVFNDPLARKNTRYPLADTEAAWRGMGGEAVTVERRAVNLL